MMASMEVSMANRMSGRCRFCERMLSEKESKEPHGLCHKCYWPRRILKRAQKAGDRVVLRLREEGRLVRWLSGE